jgi:hypothetical protein
MTATSWLKLLAPVDVTEEERHGGVALRRPLFIFSRSSQAKQYVALDLSVILVAVGVLFFGAIVDFTLGMANSSCLVKLVKGKSDWRK